MKKQIIAIQSAVVLLLVCLCVPSVGALIVAPNQPGPFHVGSYNIWYLVFPYGMYKAVIRYPATAEGWRTPVNTSEAPYPVIVVANGFAGSASQMTWAPEHLTSYGYVTLCFTPPHRLSFATAQWASGFLGGFIALQKQSTRLFSPIYDVLDIEMEGAIGLSMGGGGCIEATGMPGSTIDAAVALAPAGFPAVLAAAKNITVPIQLQVGTVDRLVPLESVLRIYTEYLSNKTVKEYLAITGANHVGFIDEKYALLAQRLGIDNPP